MVMFCHEQPQIRTPLQENSVLSAVYAAAPSQITNIMDLTSIAAEVLEIKVEGEISFQIPNCLSYRRGKAVLQGMQANKLLSK